jgi:hypothetical protein
MVEEFSLGMMNLTFIMQVTVLVSWWRVFLISLR